jgi:hypothetical protein
MAPMSTLKNLAWSALIALSCGLSAQAQELTHSTVIHSHAFDKDMKLVPLNAGNVPTLQDSLIQNLRGQLDATGQARFDAAAKKLMDKAGEDPGRQNWARFILIAALSSKAKTADQAKLSLQNIRLASHLSTLTKDPITAPEVFKGKLPDWVGKLDPAIAFPFDPGFIGRFRPGYAYAADCAKQGVPVPPPIKLNADGDLSPAAANGWQVATRNASQLAAAGLPAGKAQQQIHSYLEPSQQPGLANKSSKMYFWIPPAKAANQGICIANPIMDDPAAPEPRVTALGIICQSVSAKTKFPMRGAYRSHACFWDNNGSLDSTRSHSFTDGSFLAPPEPLTAMPNPAIHLPDDNRCTECHAGENAFVIMPDDANDMAFRSYDAVRPAKNFHDHSNWFIPLIQANWPQNVYRAYTAGTATNPNDGANCGGCHTSTFAGRLPSMQGVNPRDNLYKYCWFLLPNFMTQSHASAFDTPGAMSGNWNPVGATSGVPALYSACKALFPGNSYPQPSAGSPFPVNFNVWLQPNVQ